MLAGCHAQVVSSSLMLALLWLFFSMLVCVGIGTQMTFMKGIIDVILRQFKVLRNNDRNMVAGIAMCCTLMFLGAYPMMTAAGSQWLTMMDTEMITQFYILADTFESLE